MNATDCKARAVLARAMALNASGADRAAFNAAADAWEHLAGEKRTQSARAAGIAKAYAERQANPVPYVQREVSTLSQFIDEPETVLAREATIAF